MDVSYHNISLTLGFPLLQKKFDSIGRELVNRCLCFAIPSCHVILHFLNAVCPRNKHQLFSYLCAVMSLGVPKISHYSQRMNTRGSFLRQIRACTRHESILGAEDI